MGVRFFRNPGLLLFGLAFCFASTSVSGQTGGEIEDLEITVGKNRKLTLPEVLPDPSRAPLPLKPVITAKPTYNYIEYNVKLPEVEPKIKVLTMKPDPDRAFPSLHIRGGLAFPLATYAEVLYRSKTEKNMSWGLHGKHFNLFQGPPKAVNSGHGENFVRAYTSYFTDAVTIDGALEYRRDLFNYYGLPREQERKSDSVRQFYQYLKASLQLKQNQKTGPVGWSAGLDFSNLSDAYKASEFVLDLGGKVSYDIDSISQVVVGVQGLISRRTDSSENSRAAFWLKPSYVRHVGDLSLNVGAIVAFENDTFTNVNRVHLYPDLRASLKLIPRLLTLHAGITGNLDARTLHSHLQVNPWLGPNVALAHTNRALDVSAGVSSNPNQKLSISGQVAYRQLRNLPLYVNSFTDSSRFDIFYVRGTVQQIQLSGTIGWQVTDKLHATASVEWNNYTMPDSLKPWHLPAIKAGVNLSYAFDPKWTFGLRADYQGDMQAASAFNGESLNVPGMLNIGMRAQYKINEKFAAFADLDNLLNQQNQRYLYYPTRGALFMLGASYTMPAKR